MSKTEDIEFEIMRILADGPIPLDSLLAKLAWVDDRRWVGIAIDLHLVRDGRVRYTNCHVNHRHSGSCLLEATS